MSYTIEKEMLSTVNPVNGNKIKDFEYLSEEELNHKIEICHRAFREWKSVSLEERAKIIQKIGEALTDNKDELSKLMTDEMGKTLKQSKQEVDLCAAICKYTANLGPKMLKTMNRDMATGGKGTIAYCPIGVIYGIQPWNYPAYQVIRYSISNLMAGNGVLLKHASNVTGTGMLLEKIYREAGLPKGLFTSLVISHDQSDDVIEHNLVRGVTFTGSAEAGKGIGEKAGAALKKSVLELGSNDAYIVLEDADIDQAVELSVKGRIYNNGETCIAAKRFIVVESVYDEYRDKFVKAMHNLKTGDPCDEETDIGPMAREDLREQLHEQVQKSVENGADVLCGGKIPEGEGYFYPATVLTNVSEGQPAYDEELFGPVASLIKVSDREEAMKVANDSRFGLGGGIFSKDEDKARELAEKHFDTGMVFINSFGLADPAMPFGGVKDSGYGREHGGFGMKEFVNTKAIMVRE